ncbi:MAG TPA: acyltransferase [Flavisolibacter sp.]|nr:acyltransferase [Flavisolibacter sp.]
MSKRYIANLDGLRFLAATTVACSHLEVVKSYATDYSFDNRFIKNAPQISVTFFFVLSGFLIMWWFLEETKGNVQKINVRRFYINRISRTWPLYYLVLAISVLISVFDGTLFEGDQALKRFAFYLFFLPNSADIFHGANVFMGPTWSLAVEEFFYLLFPLILIRISQQKLLKRLLQLAAATLVFSLLFNPIFISLAAGNEIQLPGVVKYLSVIADRYRFYSFFLGAAGAYLVFAHVRLPGFFETMKAKRNMQLLALLLLLLFIFGITFSFATQQIYSVLFALFLYLMTSATYRSKLLNIGFIRTGGKISYGIYMLHMLVVIRLVNPLNFLIPTESKFLNVLVSWMLMLGLTFVISYISFRYFEMPLRNRIRRSATISVKNES